MKRKHKSKLRIGKLITFIIAIVLFGYVSFCVIDYQIYKNKYEIESVALEKRLKELKEKEEDLNNEITKLKDEEYLARYAREEFSYSKEGEYIIKIEDEAEVTQINNNKPPKDSAIYFIIIASSVVLVSIVLIIIKKKGKSKWFSFYNFKLSEDLVIKFLLS